MGLVLHLVCVASTWEPQEKLLYFSKASASSGFHGCDSVPCTYRIIANDNSWSFVKPVKSCRRIATGSSANGQRGYAGHLVGTEQASSYHFNPRAGSPGPWYCCGSSGAGPCFRPWWGHFFLAHCADAFRAPQLPEDSRVFEGKYWALNPNTCEHVHLWFDAKNYAFSPLLFFLKDSVCINRVKKNLILLNCPFPKLSLWFPSDFRQGI